MNKLTKTFLYSGILAGIWYNVYFQYSKLDDISTFLSNQDKKRMENMLKNYEENPYDIIL